MFLSHILRTNRFLLFFFFPFVTRNNAIVVRYIASQFSYIFFFSLSSSEYLFYPLRIHREQRKRISQEANDCFFEKRGSSRDKSKGAFAFAPRVKNGSRWVAALSRSISGYYNPAAVS